MKKIIVAMLLMLPCYAKAQSIDLYPLGGAFGSSKQFQVGLDTNYTSMPGCIQRELSQGQWLAGPCHNILRLDRNGKEAAHIGFGVMYNAEHGNPNYDIVPGVVVGPATKAAINATLGQLPVFENITNWTPPPFVNYMGDVLTFDYALGLCPKHTPDVNGLFRHGPMVKLNIPTSDIVDAVKYVASLLPGKHL